jgi:hypothetical protein
LGRNSATLILMLLKQLLIAQNLCRRGLFDQRKKWRLAISSAYAKLMQ